MFDDFKDLCLETQLDFQEYDFLFYDDAISFYSLRNLTNKIGSIQQLQYYAEVLLYLNPDIDYKMLLGIFRVLGNREYGKTIRTYSEARIEFVVDEVYKNKQVPYCSSWRKIIFNPSVIISSEEKMSIAGYIFKKEKSVSYSDILKAIDELKNNRYYINLDSISKILLCNEKTIRRNYNKELKEEISKYNKQLTRDKKVDELVEYIDLLSDGGEKVKIRDLQKIIRVKDYSIIKEAFEKFTVAI